MNCTQSLVESTCGCLLIRASDILHRITRAWPTVNPYDNVQSRPQSTSWIPSHPTDLIKMVNVPHKSRPMGWAQVIMLAIIWGVHKKSFTNFKTSKLITELLFHVESEFTCYLNDSQKLCKELGLQEWKVQWPSELLKLKQAPADWATHFTPLFHPAFI